MSPELSSFVNCIVWLRTPRGLFLLLTRDRSNLSDGFRRKILNDLHEVHPRQAGSTFQHQRHRAGRFGPVVIPTDLLQKFDHLLPRPDLSVGREPWLTGISMVSSDRRRIACVGNLGLDVGSNPAPHCPEFR